MKGESFEFTNISPSYLGRFLNPDSLTYGTIPFETDVLSLLEEFSFEQKGVFNTCLIRWRSILVVIVFVPMVNSVQHVIALI